MTGFGFNTLALLVAIPAARDGQLYLLVQLVQQGKLRRAVGAVGLAGGIQRGRQHGHGTP